MAQVRLFFAFFYYSALVNQLDRAQRASMHAALQVLNERTRKNMRGTATEECLIGL